ncbi:MAG TPA: hypothetical protein VME67_09765 [Mycobacterium sp.]|nr:hypothetical protein [Mycobacterium sp.]HTX95096.1 hypothetical protein [Mycobacterium sp.]
MTRPRTPAEQRRELLIQQLSALTPDQRAEVVALANEPDGRHDRMEQAAAAVRELVSHHPPKTTGGSAA